MAGKDSGIKGKKSGAVFDLAKTAPLFYIRKRKNWDVLYTVKFKGLTDLVWRKCINTQVVSLNFPLQLTCLLFLILLDCVWAGAGL